MTDVPTVLTSKQLAIRWGLAENTIRKWRVAGIGPAYMKLGDGRSAEVRYRIVDVEQWEKDGIVPTSRPKPSGRVL